MRLPGDTSGRGTRRSGRRFFGLLAAAMVVSTLAVAACGGDDDGGDGSGSASTSQSSEPTKVRVAFTAGFGTLPVRIAQEKGYFKENGLDVQATEGLDLAAWLSALDKQFDIVMSLPSQILAASSQGAQVTVISNMQITDPEHPNNVLVVKDPSIQGPGDLGGKRVGVPTLTGGSAQAVLYAAMQAGVDKDDVKLVQTPFDTQADQLNAGRIDAVVSAIPFFTAQEKAGLQVRDDVIVEAVKAATGGAVDRATTATFIATPSFASENPEAVEAWKKSLQQGIEFIESNEAEARKILETWLKLPPEIAQEAPLPGLDVEILADDISPYVEIGQALGTLKGDVPDVESLIYKAQ